MLKIQGRSPQSLPRDVVRAATPARAPVFGPKSVGSFVPRLTRQAFEKYGFSAATLITDWETIVGAALAGYTAPERLKWPKGAPGYAEAGEASDRGRPGATLVLGVDPGRALDVQYRAQQIMERINAYFGYRAVAELRIVQLPAGSLARPRTAAVPLSRHAGPPPADVAAVSDEKLRDALTRMAQGLTTRATSL